MPHEFFMSRFAFFHLNEHIFDFGQHFHSSSSSSFSFSFSFASSEPTGRVVAAGVVRLSVPPISRYTSVTWRRLSLTFFVAHAHVEKKGGKGFVNTPQGGGGDHKRGHDRKHKRTSRHSRNTDRAHAHTAIERRAEHVASRERKSDPVFTQSRKSRPSPCSIHTRVHTARRREKEKEKGPSFERRRKRSLLNTRAACDCHGLRFHSAAPPRPRSWR